MLPEWSASSSLRSRSSKHSAVMDAGVTLAKRCISRPLAASQVSTSRPAAVTNERAVRLYSPPASGCGSVSDESSSSGPWLRQYICMLVHAS